MPMSTRPLITYALPFILAASLSACSGLQRSTASLPDQTTLDALPVIHLGQAKPATGDYIVYMPASEPLSATTRVQGNLFEQAQSAQLQVKLRKDLYLYKNWVSHDKRQWLRDTDAMGGNVRVELPGYDRPKAGEVLIELNTKG